MSSERSRARSSVKRRRKGVYGDGGTYLGILELNDLLPAVERQCSSEIRLDVLARLPHCAFGAEKLVEVFAFDVLAAREAVDGDAQRERRHRHPGKSAGIAPQSRTGGCQGVAGRVGGVVEMVGGRRGVLLASLAVVHNHFPESVFLH